jgi:hypothetical protein
VRGFSTASRRRLLWLIAQIAEPILNKALFLTLTYPTADPQAEHAKRHLDTLLKVLRRKAPDASAIWKLEYTKAGTPHFHLLVLNLNRWAYDDLALTWGRIVGSAHESHQAAGTRVERVRSKKHVARYIVKYISKGEPIPDTHLGRVWGKAGPIALAFAAKQLFLLSRDAFLRARRFLWLLRKSYNRRRPFRKAHKTDNLMRQFATGAVVLRYLKALPPESAIPLLV